MLDLIKNSIPQGLAASGIESRKPDTENQCRFDYYTTDYTTDQKNVRQDDYNEYVDKSQKHDESGDFQGKPWPACAKWALSGHCENNHQFYKVILCGKEWCPDCGEEGSWIHNRRVARWLPKVQQLDGFGYWVIEWPVKSRGKLRSKESLSDMGKRVKGAFMALKYDRGLRRWHWFGDPDETGKVRGWNPHLNIITKGGFISKKSLNCIKSYLRDVLGESDLIVHYSYRNTVPKMVHGLKYITRATFRNVDWDPGMVPVVDGFHNSQTWGVWKDEPVWHLDERRKVASLEKNICPVCHKPIKWDSAVASIAEVRNLYDQGFITDEGGGYFRSKLDSPPERMDIESQERLSRWREKAVSHRRDVEKLFMEDPAAVYRLYCRRQELWIELDVVNRIRRNTN